MKEEIVFFGSSKFVIPIIEVLQKNFDLKLVVTTEKNPTDAIPNYCKSNNIDYLSVSTLSDPKVNSQLLNVNCQIAILADFGLIIPQSILNMFPMGIINIHPSLLPKFRGPTPVQSAILEGVKETGVSIMKLDEQIDHGPILGQEKEDVLNTDTAESLYKRLFEKGANLLLRVLDKYLDGSLQPIPQDHSKAIFTKPLTRQDGYVEISDKKQEIGKIKQKIRAYYPWPGVWTNLMINDKGLRIKLLPNEKIQVEGKKPVSYKDFMNGYPEFKQKLEKLLEQQA